MPTDIKTCAFTGHRHIKEEHRKELGQLLFRAIEYAYSFGCRRFLSGGAVGFDTEAAREVLRFRLSHPDISLVMVLPCIELDARWSDRQKDAYVYILSEANEVRYISERYDDNCMRRRNLVLAEECDVMVAYVSKSNSGAAQTVRMADKQGKKIYNLYPTLDNRCKV